MYLYSRAAAVLLDGFDTGWGYVYFPMILPVLGIVIVHSIFEDEVLNGIPKAFHEKTWTASDGHWLDGTQLGRNYFVHINMSAILYQVAILMTVVSLVF